jgi:hypothetical protein
MQHQSSCCDFCGDSRTFQDYATDHGGINWYACVDCARLIQAEHWGQLIEHSLAAYRQIRRISDGEEPILRDHVEQLVGAFRAFRVVPV